MRNPKNIVSHLVFGTFSVVLCASQFSCKERKFHVSGGNETKSFTSSELSILPRAMAQDTNTWKWGCGPTDYLTRIKATPEGEDSGENYASALAGLKCAPGSASVMPMSSNAFSPKADGNFFCCAIPVGTTMAANWKAYSERLKK